MAKVNFNNIDEVEQSNSTNSAPGSDIGFFTLKNDLEEAIVRFLYTNTDDFEILTVHEVQVGSKYRKVNCIRDPREPLDMCPLCNSGARISNRFFIKMIQYEKVLNPTTQQTTIVPKAVVWDRSTAYAKTLKSYLDNYGPLDDIICKIIRHGKAGDMQTTYEIVPNLSKSVYPDSIYVKDTSLFGDFTAFGTFVMDRNYEELSHFVVNGEFPVRQNTQTAAPTSYAAAPIQQPVTVPANLPGVDNYMAAQNPTNYYNPPVEQAPVAPPVSHMPQFSPAPAPQPQPNQFGGAAFYNNPSTGSVERPRRY